MIKTSYIHRDIEPEIKKLARHFPAVVITGPRQSGKSTLLQTLFGKTHEYVTLDDPVTREEALADPKFFLQALSKGAIIDEIQYAPQLLSYLKIAIDQDRDKRGRFILTGSQQFNMMKEIGDTLAGRVGIAELLPFSLNEKSRVSGKKQLIAPEDYFTDAALRGSFPEIVTHPQLKRDSWYGAYLQTYLERDIRSLYNIGHLREFQTFLKLLATRTGQILNLNALSAAAGVTVNTLRQWLSVLQASRIVYLLPPYYTNLGKRMVKSPKVYFLDSGLLCYLLSVQDRTFLLKSPLSGPLFESFVIQESVKAFLNRGLRPPLYYLRTHNGVEVDLLIEKNQSLYPVEIKISKTPRLADGEPMMHLKRILSGLPWKPGRIVSLSPKNQDATRDLSMNSVNHFIDWMREI